MCRAYKIIIITIKVEERGGKNTEKWRGKWKENRKGEEKREKESREL